MSRSWSSGRWILTCIVIAQSAWQASAGATDQEYQKWASRVYQEDDEEGKKMGQAIACAFCQICANAAKKQLEMNRERPREERFGEEEIQEVLLELCQQTAPSIASSIGGYTKDAMMVCKRVANEHVGDMVDAASLGEDMDDFCKENGVCPLRMDHMMQFMEAIAKAKGAETKNTKTEPGTTIEFDKGGTAEL